jgi:flagellar export protein FliJ
MRHFRFRLESVRSLREHAEQRAQEELARELDAKAARMAELSLAREGLSAARGQATPTLGGGATADVLRAQQAYLERRQHEERIALASVADQEHAVEVRRHQLGERAREREQIERLRDRRLREHQRARTRAEDASLSEVALAAHRRRAGGTR